MKMEGRDSAECQNWEKKDLYGIFEILNYNRTKTQIVSSPTYEKGREKSGGEKKILQEVRYFGFRERVWLLSRNTGDPTVGSLQGKKENCSTRRGLRVGTRYKEFRQTP